MLNGQTLIAFGTIVISEIASGSKKKKGIRIHSTTTNPIIVLIANIMLGCFDEDDEGFSQMLQNFSTYSVFSVQECM